VPSGDVKSSSDVIGTTVSFLFWLGNEYRHDEGTWGMFFWYLMRWISLHIVQFRGEATVANRRRWTRVINPPRAKLSLMSLYPHVLWITSL
jgi:hypothetical protein